MIILVHGVAGENFWVALPFTAVIVALWLIALIRFGLLALSVAGRSVFGNVVLEE